MKQVITDPKQKIQVSIGEMPVAIAKLFVGLAPGKKSKREREWPAKMVEEIVLDYFGGATIDEAVGIYEGGRESTIEIILVNCCEWKEDIETFTKRVFELAEELQQKLEQDSVLVEFSVPQKKEIYEMRMGTSLVSDE